MKTGQSKRWSLFEVTTNIVTGSLLGIVMNMVILPLWGFTVSVGSAVGIGVVYSAISFVRSYLFRRLFNWIDVRRQLNENQRETDGARPALALEADEPEGRGRH